jgi:hypothetical protein
MFRHQTAAQKLCIKVNNQSFETVSKLKHLETRVKTVKLSRYAIQAPRKRESIAPTTHS